MANASLFDLVDKAAKDNTRALKELKAVLERTPSPTLALVDAAVSDGGTVKQREALQLHRMDFPWCTHMNLSLQEFKTVLPDDVGFENNVRTALSSAAWGYDHRRALEKKGAVAARKLLKDLHAIAAEAVVLLDQVTALRKRITPTLHALQVLTLQRMEKAVPSLKNKRVLEVGCQDGGLFGYLKGQGVDAWALDLVPKLSDPRVLVGDFMKDTVPGRFDVVLATAVFEFGSGWEHVPENGMDDVKLLQRLHLLLNPGGVVVMENIGCPVPFAAEAARANGFDVVDTRTLVHTLAEGGRGCALRRKK